VGDGLGKHVWVLLSQSINNCFFKITTTMDHCQRREQQQ
jgi:hypothetical protein